MLLRAGFWLIKERVGNLLSRVFESINTGDILRANLFKRLQEKGIPMFWKSRIYSRRLGRLNRQLNTELWILILNV